MLIESRVRGVNGDLTGSKSQRKKSHDLPVQIGELFSSHCRCCQKKKRDGEILIYECNMDSADKENKGL